MLVFGTEEEGGGLWVANVLLLYIISIRESSKSWGYAFLQYMEVKRPKVMVD